MKKRIRLGRVELWASRSALSPDWLRVGDDEHNFSHVCAVHSPPNARGEYPIAQPGNVVPVVLRPDWRRHLK